MVMNDIHDIARKKLMRHGMILMLTMLLVASAVPAQARHGYRRHHAWIAPRVVVPVVPWWAPYTYTYPPVVVAPPPRVYVQSPPPQSYWYYCDSPEGYYPYVAQCPGGWRAVVPTPAQ
jgi:hypothetical protein